MIIPRHYENLKIMHENTMPYRAYYIPASKRMENLVQGRDANEDGRNQTAAALLEGSESKDANVYVEENDRHLIIAGEAFEYIYSKLTGMFIQMTCDGKQMLDRPMEVNIWRAPMDNDRKIKEVWMNAHYHESMTRAYETSWKRKGSEVVIQNVISVLAVSVQKVLDIKTTWTISSTGEINVSKQLWALFVHGITHA